MTDSWFTFGTKGIEERFRLRTYGFNLTTGITDVLEHYWQIMSEDEWADQMPSLSREMRICHVTFRVEIN